MLPINKQLGQFFASVAIMASTSAVFAQKLSQFNTYNFDLMQVNVASMGSTCFEANLNYRTQAIKANDAPALYQLTSSLRLADKQAVGIKLYHQSVGLSSFNNITGAYSYKLKLGSDGSFNFAAGVSFLQVGFDANRAVVIDEDDDMLTNQGSVLRANNFDCEMGGELKWKDLKAGVSVNHLYNTNKNTGNATFKTPQMFNVYGTYKINLSDKLELMPWVLARYSLDGIFLPEVLVNTRYKKMLSLGLGYRYPRGVFANFGAEVAKLKIVYSLEYNLGTTYKALGTTHQIMLGFDLCQRKTKEGGND